MNAFSLAWPILAVAALSGPATLAADVASDATRAVATHILETEGVRYTARLWRGEPQSAAQRLFVNRSSDVVSVSTPDFSWSVRVKPGQTVVLNDAPVDAFLIGVTREGAAQHIVVAIAAGDVVNFDGPEQE